MKGGLSIVEGNDINSSERTKPKSELSLMLYMNGKVISGLGMALFG